MTSQPRKPKGTPQGGEFDRGAGGGLAVTLNEYSEISHNAVELTKDDIIRLLCKLDAELESRGEKVVVYVIGGANVSIAIDAKRTTTDIDVVVKRGLSVLSDAAKAVSETEPEIEADWINTQFTADTYKGGITWPWFDNKDDDNPSTFLDGKGLKVELASPEMVLALKTLAQRPKDMDDIYALMRLTGITDAQGLGRNLARFTGKRIFEAQGSPGMFIHIDPKFSYIFDNAPDDLRPIRLIPWYKKLRRRK